MSEQSDQWQALDLERAIVLRWKLRDIVAGRLQLSPIGRTDLHDLIAMGLVEIRDDKPVVTQAGLDRLR